MDIRERHRGRRKLDKGDSREEVSVANPGTCSAREDHPSQTDRQDTQSAFSARLSVHGFNVYRMFVVDVLHEFELGVWKAILTHLIRILYAEGNDRIQTMNTR